MDNGARMMPCSDIITSKSKPSWWLHQVETFYALLAICMGNSLVSGEFPTQRPVTQSFGVFFDLRLNKQLSKQSWGWWFETLSRPLWHHRNDTALILYVTQHICNISLPGWSQISEFNILHMWNSWLLKQITHIYDNTIYEQDIPILVLTKCDVIKSLKRFAKGISMA